MIGRGPLTVVITLALLGASCVDGTVVGSEQPDPPRTTTTTEATAPSISDTLEDGDLVTVPCEAAPTEVAIVCEAYELIQENYVDEVSDQVLVDAAVEGLEQLSAGRSPDPFVCPLPSDDFVVMCEAATGRDPGDSSMAEHIVSAFALYGLDPNSIYIDEEALALLQEEQQGQIEGIGALVSTEDETIEGEDKQCGIISETCRVVVASTIEKSPADEAGLRSGDVIVGVNGEDTRGWTIEELAARVRGPAGTDVRLTISRGEETFDVTITRASVVIPILESARFGDDGYIRLRVFNATADDQFKSAVVELLGEGIDDLVVDLRNNPGGLLDTAIQVTSVFLSSGDVVVTEGPDNESSYPVIGTSLVPADVDVIVVVNGGSASASEVVSAVLQERDVALVVGEATFGKNTVQQRYSLSNGGALKLTIARWLTPGGLDFGGTGVVPDVEMIFDNDATPEEIIASVVNLG